MTEKTQILKSTSVITLATLVSRLLGYIRDQRIALLLGTTVLSDSFFLAFRIPNLLRRLIAEGSMSASFVPVFSSYQVDKSHEEIWDFANRLFWTLAVILAVIAALGMIFAPTIIHLFTMMSSNPAAWSYAIHLNRIIFPFIFFIGLSALCMAILNCYHVFALPAATPAVSNMGMIIFSTAVVWKHFESPAAALAVGVVFGGMLQFLVQLPQLVRRGMTFKFGISFRHPGIRKVARLMIPGVFGLGVAQLNVYVDTIFLTSRRMPNGSVTSLYFADRIMQLVLGSFAVAVATAILPMMSRQARMLDFDAVKRTLGFSVRIVSFITIPAAIGIVLLRQPIIRVLFQHGRFVAESTQLTAWVLGFYALGLPAMSAVKLIVQAFYSTRDTKTPVSAAAGILLLNVVLNVIFVTLFFSQLRNGGPALATVIAAYANCVALFLIFRQRYGRIGGRQIVISSSKAVAASAVMGAACWAAVQYGRLGDHVRLSVDAALLAATIGGACALYLGATWILRSVELKEVYELIFHRHVAPDISAGAV